MIFPVNDRSFSSAKKGFTLLELLVVTFIMALLAAMLVPAFGKGESRRLNDAADHMVMLINQAQQESIMSSRIWQVVIEPFNHTYYFSRHTESGFEKVTRGPFADIKPAPTIEFADLVINGEKAASPGEIYLFPTGEQDAFRLSLRAGEYKRIISMHVVGQAEVNQ